jgi:hypothetical protein
MNTRRTPLQIVGAILAILGVLPFVFGMMGTLSVLLQITLGMLLFPPKAIASMFVATTLGFMAMRIGIKLNRRQIVCDPE